MYLKVQVVMGKGGGGNLTATSDFFFNRKL